ncbi:hypothetical protein CKM354_000608600 [Cercospora kikuchii]|uniref:Apple domain-containing protein n=1 Tax=Cercospora kikuchii TaxID=84275 RepID=A0A9P3CHG6_9PEZI|nr:uncharacterized protein CKM354_000608600 [Cercospora kikuchii]GIZ42833.1 hypothetical protein CKM354_000608600 [Cercospora kikuchii]
MQYLKSISLLACLLVASDAAVLKRSDCRAGQTTIDGQLFTTQCDVDRAGNNFGNPVRTTPSGCAAACAADSTCVTSQYNTGNGFCYLKNSPNQLSLVPGTNTYDRGSGCTSNINVSGCTVQCDTDSPGNDLSGTYTGSYAQCAVLCSQNVQCVTAQYNAGNGYCYQKSRVNGDGFRPVAGTHSLVCPH